MYAPTALDPCAYIVMELMDYTLDEVLERTGCMTEFEAAHIIASIAKGLDYCHKKGIMHHDLKLENILVKTNAAGVVNRVKLADFGLSRKTSDKLVAGIDSRGTIAYASPEMLKKGQIFNERIDSWAIGVIFYYLLMNQEPFGSDDLFQTVESIKKQEIDFRETQWENFSVEALNLLD